MTAIPSSVLLAAVKLAERHNSLEAAEWVMQWFGVMTFGVEHIDFPENSDYCNYVNRGDTYADTVYYDDASGEYCIGSWGDWLESVEAAYAECTGNTRCMNCGEYSQHVSDSDCDHCAS